MSPTVPHASSRSRSVDVIPRPSVLLAEITPVVGCPWPHVGDARRRYATLLQSAEPGPGRVGAGGGRGAAVQDGRRQRGGCVHFGPVGIGVRAARRGRL